MPKVDRYALLEKMKRVLDREEAVGAFFDSEPGKNLFRALGIRHENELWGIGLTVAEKTSRLLLAASDKKGDETLWALMESLDQFERTKIKASTVEPSPARSDSAEASRNGSPYPN